MALVKSHCCSCGRPHGGSQLFVIPSLASAGTRHAQGTQAHLQTSTYARKIERKKYEASPSYILRTGLKTAIKIRQLKNEKKKRYLLTSPAKDSQAESSIEALVIVHWTDRSAFSPKTSYKAGAMEELT